MGALFPLKYIFVWLQEPMLSVFGAYGKCLLKKTPLPDVSFGTENPFAGNIFGEKGTLFRKGPLGKETLSPEMSGKGAL